MRKYLRKTRLWKELSLLKFRIKLLVYGEEWHEKRTFTAYVGYVPNLKEPKTLNEKMAWLKINYYENFFRICCDKFYLHKYLEEKIGKDIAPQLLFVTKNVKELTYKNIKDFPCIIKVSNGSGSNLIITDKAQYTESYLQKFFKKCIFDSKLHAYNSLEHQYSPTDSYIVVEKLLSDENGGIPNDYKFLCINGNIEFIYCSVDRLGENVRQVYDINWNRLHFIWVENANEELFKKYENSASIPKPKNFEEMKRLATQISQDFPLVRVDFYDAQEGLFVGEITLHHGSAHDCFYPQSYDLFYGEKLSLPSRNR